jgi:FecR-like protein
MRSVLYRIAARALPAAVVLASLLVPGPSFAQSDSKIGAATSIENEVEARMGRSIEKLAVGSNVFQDQLVRTGKASTAALQFLDETNLNLSPSTEIKLDRFVYDPGQKKGTVVLQVPRGVVRFVTGTMESKSYSIRTSLVTIGVRGTTFDVLSWPDRVTVRLVDGAVDLTLRSRRVITLDRPNTAITIYRDGRIVGPRDWNGPVTDFANLAVPSPPSPPSRAAAPVRERAAVETPSGAPAPRGGGGTAMDRLGGSTVSTVSGGNVGVDSGGRRRPCQTCASNASGGTRTGGSSGTSAGGASGGSKSSGGSGGFYTSRPIPREQSPSPVR